MINAERQRIRSRASRDTFTGRSAHLARIVGAAADGTSLTILSAPRAGASELLRQAYDHLFYEQKEVIPIYFEIERDDGTLEASAGRFARELLLQSVAFRRRAPSISRSAASLDELDRLTPAADAAWIDDLIEAVQSRDDDADNFARRCFSLPVRAAAKGVRFALLFDAVQISETLARGKRLLSTLEQLSYTPGISLVMAGHRRHLFDKTAGQSITLDYLPHSEATELVSAIADDQGVATNDQTVDLISVRSDGDPFVITSLFAAAARSGSHLDNFEKVETLYTDELFGGSISRRFERDFSNVVEDVQARRDLISALARSGGEEIPIAFLRKQLNAGCGISDEQLSRLHFAEFIDLTASSVRVSDRTAIRSYLTVAHKLDSGKPRGLVVGEITAENIRDAPRIMSASYRQRAALDLRSLLAAFNGARIPAGAIDYGIFRSNKGLADDQIAAALVDEAERIRMPRIVYTVAAGAIYPQLDELLPHRAAVGLGFDENGSSTAIIAAQIDSKLEATVETAEFWCDRLEMLAVTCGFEDHRIWLIAPEGFDEEALAALARRNAFTSSIRQIRFLSELLTGEPHPSEVGEEYELTIPMGNESELLAAKLVDEIAARYGMDPKSVTQIKTALVEACINAAEHSLSPDGRVRIKAHVNNGQLVLNVSNRGLRLQDRLPTERTGPVRGWGLELIGKLMDAVHINATDDGTSLTMIKNLSSDRSS